MYLTVNTYKNTFYCQEIQFGSSNYFTQLPQTTNLLSMPALTLMYHNLYCYPLTFIQNHNIQGATIFPQMYTTTIYRHNLNQYSLLCIHTKTQSIPIFTRMYTTTTYSRNNLNHSFAFTKMYTELQH